MEVNGVCNWIRTSAQDRDIAQMLNAINKRLGKSIPRLKLRKVENV